MRAFLLLVVASCTHDVTVFDRVDVREPRDLDILYVFDNSSDRGRYDQMASQLADLQTRLLEVDGQLPSLHVGLVTTDLGTRGTEDVLPAPAFGNCAGNGDNGRLVAFDSGVPDGSFLEDFRGPDGTRIRNYKSGDLLGELARLTNPAPGASTTGCEFEQPLEAMRRALDPKTNPGFLRPGAMLSVVFLTSEDDCSLATGAMLDPLDPTLGPLGSFRCTEQGVICDEPDPRRPGTRTSCRPREGSRCMVDVAAYQTFLEQLKRDRRDVVVSAVAGPREPFDVMDIGFPVLSPSCQGPGGSAMPPVRLGALVDSFGGAMVNGCTQEAAYQQLATPIVNPQRACFPNLRRSDGENCSVVEIAGDTETELGRCADGSASPCWYTYADAASCPTGENIGIAVRRGEKSAPTGARIQATCFAQ